MDLSCLEHCLTEEERRTFDETGLLIVPDALPADLVSRLEAALDRLHAERRTSGLGPYEGMFCPNFVGRDPLFLELLDWPKVFPKVWGILGWNIYLYHGHCGVNPPLDPEAERVKRTLGWHQDSGRVNTEMESHPRPRLSLKVAYFLSDCSEPGRGNFHVLPGSHLRDTLQKPEDGVSDPEGAMPVCVKPGAAVFFDRRLWHAASPNWSGVTRKALFYGYGYRWIRTKDDMTIPPEWFARSSPVRQQLLGGGVNCNGHFSPTDADVPLRVWLRENRPEDAG
ncbi:MAG TPA: phytanoyl-CoA dioxygenase family protein [Armatimonadota bacterium]|nr:phytanoyl-CoA dioxygenase family protein [Armatimonadota bacterium]